MHVYLVDPYDIFVGKLFSKRSKDLDDLRDQLSKLQDAKDEAGEGLNERRDMINENDLEEDRHRYFVSDQGIVVIPKRAKLGDS